MDDQTNKSEIRSLIKLICLKYNCDWQTNQIKSNQTKIKKRFEWFGFGSENIDMLCRHHMDELINENFNNR